MTSDSEPLEDGSHPTTAPPFSLSTCPTLDSLRRFRVTDLRTLLSSRALNTAGKKEELMKRLWESVQAEQVVQAMDQEEKEGHATSSTAIDSGADKGETKEKKLLAEKTAEAKKSVLPTFKMSPGGKSSALPSAASPEAAAPPMATAQAASEEQKKEARAQRFISETDAKKQARAERFGISSAAEGEKRDHPMGGDEGRKKLRAERFGASLASPSSSKAKTALDAEGLAKLRERGARFGETSSRMLARHEAEEAKQKRAERFTSS